MAKENHILVVDDEVVIRELMVDILSDEGYPVEVAPDGPTALEMLEQDDRFVVLFTDIMMEGMNGIELIRRARRIAPFMVPIVMTGYATLETAQAALKEGAYDYVLKPFNLSEIKMAVSNALERCRLTRENTRLLEVTELFNISENIASMREETQILDYLLQAALQRVEADRGSIMLVSEDGRRLEVTRSIGLPIEAGGAVVEMSDSISGWVAANVQPLLVSDIRQEPLVGNMSHKLRENSFVSVPLERKASRIGGGDASENHGPRVLAVLNVTEKRNGQAFTEGDLKTLSIISNHGAAALENVRLLRDVEDTQREIIFTLGEIVETRSMETGNHVKRVAEYCKMLAVKTGLSPAEAEMLRLAAPLHDVGKVGIPDAVLNKPGKLDPGEFEVIKTHAQVGYDMLKAASGRVLQASAIIALQHHERFDGKGYPLGLSGKDIHLYGRIAGIADVFDALGVKRVYKDAWPLPKIIDYFCDQRGLQFDPDLTDVFFSHIDEVIAIRSEFPELAD